MRAPRSILIIAPHTDDAELGCGGAIARYAEAGAVVHVAAFSDAADVLPEGWPRDRLVQEMKRSLLSLGVKEANIHNYSMPVRRFLEHRQAILDEMIKLRAKTQPDLVFVPASQDVHQDHSVVHKEALRAFRDASIWGYELPWNHFTTVTTGFVVLEDRHMELKLAALRFYESQIELRRPYFEPDILMGLAKLRGVQIKTRYAEAFEVVRAIA